MVVVGLGLIEFLFWHLHAKRAFSAMRRSQRRQDYLRPLDLSSRPENQVEADPSVASCANSVKKALDVIEEAVATVRAPHRLPFASVESRQLLVAPCLERRPEASAVSPLPT